MKKLLLVLIISCGYLYGMDDELGEGTEGTSEELSFLAEVELDDELPEVVGFDPMSSRVRKKRRPVSDLSPIVQRLSSDSPRVSLGMTVRTTSAPALVSPVDKNRTSRMRMQAKMQGEETRGEARFMGIARQMSLPIKSPEIVRAISLPTESMMRAPGSTEKIDDSPTSAERRLLELSANRIASTLRARSFSQGDPRT